MRAVTKHRRVYRPGDRVASDWAKRVAPFWLSMVMPLDTLKAAYGNTGNPVFLWMAVCVLTQRGERQMPAWIVEYLKQTSWNLTLLVLTYEIMGRNLPRSDDFAQAFQLVTRTANAVASFSKDQRDRAALHAFNRDVARGKPAGAVIEAFANAWGEDTRSVQRKLARARRTFGLPAPSNRTHPRRPKRQG